MSSPDPLDGWPAFTAAVRQRLEAGRAAYGHKSFTRDPAELAREIDQELLDVCGWAFVLHSRMVALGSRLRPAEHATAAEPGEPWAFVGEVDAGTLAELGALSEHLRMPPGLVLRLALRALRAELERSGKRHPGLASKPGLLGNGEPK